MGKLFLVHKLYLVNLVINRTAIEMPSDVQVELKTLLETYGLITQKFTFPSYFLRKLFENWLKQSQMVNKKGKKMTLNSKNWIQPRRAMKGHSGVIAVQQTRVNQPRGQQHSDRGIRGSSSQQGLDAILETWRHWETIGIKQAKKRQKL